MVESCLREAIKVSEVVERIDDVERVHNRRRLVSVSRRFLCEVRSIVKVKVRRSLNRDVNELKSKERDTVVATPGELGYFEL